ncbi:MAG TPA: hypothetical protein VMU65_08590 [Candidatus Saccharimonadales bacterium]|nr:hypothetical protein [Candidatus Saccharimonadales bacterium]
MRVKAHLTVINGRVACPSTGQWEDLGHCADCVDLQAIEGQDGPRPTVICRPKVDSFAAVLERVMRA